MNGTDGQELQFDTEERLPWLEPIDDVEQSDVSIGRLVGLVVAGLVAIGAVVGGLWYWQTHGGRPRGELIAAPEGPYRTNPPAEPGRFDGDGNAAVAAAEGVRPTGAVDPNALPEAPVAPPVAAGNAPRSTAPASRPTPPAAANRSVATAPARPAPAPAATPAPTAPAAGGGSGMIQLGAFASEATAARAWDSLKARFAWLGPVNRSIVPAEVGGRTVYRLRAAAGSASAARSLCARLRVAGENCMVLP